MVTDKRKAQLREGNKNTRQRKKDAGKERVEIWIKTTIKSVFKSRVKELIAELESYKG